MAVILRATDTAAGTTFKKEGPLSLGAHGLRRHRRRGWPRRSDGRRLRPDPEAFHPDPRAQATGGQLEWLYPTKSVYDYPSYIAIEGGELAELFVLHSRESGAEIRAEEVVDVQRQASGFKLTTREGNAYEARSIILAMGMGLLEPK